MEHFQKMGSLFSQRYGWLLVLHDQPNLISSFYCCILVLYDQALLGYLGLDISAVGYWSFMIKPYLDIWVGDHLCCHNQLVPVLLICQHPSCKFNPCKKYISGMNLCTGRNIQILNLRNQNKMCYLLPRTGYPVTMQG